MSAIIFYVIVSLLAVGTIYGMGQDLSGLRRPRLSPRPALSLTSRGFDHLPWATFEAFCSCGFNEPASGYEDQKLAEAEVEHFVKTGCGGLMQRRELPDQSFGDALRNKRGQIVGPTVFTAEKARSTLLRLCDAGMTMEDAAVRMGDSAKLAAFPLAPPLPRPDRDLFERVYK